MRSIITTLILLSILFIGCSKEIEPAYKEVALKYRKNIVKNVLHESINKLIEEQKEHQYEAFLEYFNSSIKEEFPVGDISPNAMASYLDDIWHTAITVIRRYKPEYEDSIRGRSVLSGFSHMSYDLDDELLRDARFFDLVSAYTVYLPQSAMEKINDSKGDIYGWELVDLDLRKPYFWDGESKDVEQMAFAFIRRNILLRKLRDTFSEKQKLYMEENSILFLESLNEKQAKIFDEKQAKIFREYNKYNEYLEYSYILQTWE